MDVAVIGGTGEEGFGLTLQLARAGHHVTIGSRSAEKGAGKAEEARALLGGDATIDGTTNEEAAATEGVIVVTVPFEGQAETYRAIKPAVAAGPIVLDATSPLATAVGGRPWQVVRPWHGSAAEQADAILSQGVRTVAAFHTIAGHELQQLEQPARERRARVRRRPRGEGGRGFARRGHPGPPVGGRGALSMARIVETMTALLISVNRTYKVRGAGFRIVGRDAWGDPRA